MSTSSPVKLPHHEAHAASTLANCLLGHYRNGIGSRSIVVCCIGTDRSTGDSLGPIVGSRLSKHANSNYTVFGTLDEPVHAMNLSEKIHEIHLQFEEPYIIAVDASLGQLSSIGTIQLGDGPLKPGTGVNKQLPAVGNIHVTGIVNVSGFMEYFVLQNTRLSLVMNMADVIAEAIHDSLQTWQQMQINPLVQSSFRQSHFL